MFAQASVDRILVVKLADLGDLLLAEPAIRSLREGFPGARVDLITTPQSRELCEILPSHFSTITFPKQIFDQFVGLANPVKVRVALQLAATLRGARYDMVVILHHLSTAAGAAKFRALAAATGAGIVAGLDNGRGTFLTVRVPDLGFGSRHEVEYMLSIARAVGGAEVYPRPTVCVPDVDAELALPDSFIGIYPQTGGYSPARSWPAERYAQLCDRLVSAGNAIVLLGGSDAIEPARTIRAIVPSVVDLTGATTLRELAKVVATADIVVGGDSFIGHLAAALGRPQVAIFGPSNHHAWAPFGAIVGSRSAPPGDARSAVITADVPCAPCLYTGFSLGRRLGCPVRTCLDLVSVDLVFDAIRTIGGEALK